MREFFTDKKFIGSKILLLTKILLAGVLVIFFFPLIVLPFFNHPFADDYYNGFQLNTGGFMHYQTFMYLNWTGRFAATFIWSLFEYKGFLYNHYYLHSLLLLFLNFISIFFLINVTDKYILKENFRLSNKLLFSFLFLALEICSLPELSTFLFWFTSSITYYLPVILVQAEIALFIVFFNSGNTITKNICAVLLPLLVFMIIGFNELFILIQLALFGILFYLKLHTKCQRIFILFIVLSFAAGSALLLLAPGNQARSGLINSRSIFSGLAAISYNSFETLWSIFKNPLIWFTGIVIFGFAARTYSQQNRYINKLSQKRLFIPGAIFLFLLACIVLAVIALKGRLIPDRYLNPVSCCMLLLLLPCFFIAGVNNSSRISFQLPATKDIVIHALLIIVLLCNTYIANAYKSLVIAPVYDNILTERESALKQAAQENKTAVVKDYYTALSELLKTKYSSATVTFQQLIQEKPPLLFFEDDLTDDYSISVLKKYYGLDSVLVERNNFR
ncbi:MAG TPA: DUF6056 family protein [Parafilimonas sp.]|nr:DUF6056 family protein [Parafilimonas sp.]